MVTYRIASFAFVTVHTKDLHSYTIYTHTQFNRLVLEQTYTQLIFSYELEHN